jgi:hypothetical protein
LQPAFPPLIKDSGSSTPNRKADSILSAEAPPFTPTPPLIAASAATVIPTQAAGSSSWATIAAPATAQARTYKLHDPSSITVRGKRAISLSMHTANTPPQPRRPSRNLVSLLKVREPLWMQHRLVFILNLPPRISLSAISSSIREGPLASIKFGLSTEDNSRFVGIVFQHADDADAYLHLLARERQTQTARRFTFMPDVRRGDPYPADATIQSMAGPTSARRRLTIVKAGLFFKWKEAELRALCEREAGKDCIETVFVYNGGNATVIVSGVDGARKIKTVLDLWGTTKPAFEGVNVHYSRDPCEGEGIRLIAAGDPQI